MSRTYYVRERCEMCGGHGKLISHDGPDLTLRDCEECGGAGRLDVMLTEALAQLGAVPPSPDAAMRGARESRTGQELAAKAGPAHTCGACKGTGRVGAGDKTVRCYACAGVGRILPRAADSLTAICHECRAEYPHDDLHTVGRTCRLCGKCLHSLALKVQWDAADVAGRVACSTAEPEPEGGGVLLHIDWLTSGRVSLSLPGEGLQNHLSDAMLYAGFRAGDTVEIRRVRSEQK